MTTRLSLLLLALLILPGCGQKGSIKPVPQQISVPPPPPAAEIVCKGAVPEADNAPLGVTEINDETNTQSWVTCILANAAARRYFDELRAKGYIKQ